MRRSMDQNPSADPPSTSTISSHGEVPSRLSSQMPASAKATMVTANCSPMPANLLPDMPLRLCRSLSYSACCALRSSVGVGGFWGVFVRVTSVPGRKLRLVKFFSSFRSLAGGGSLAWSLGRSL